MRGLICEKGEIRLAENLAEPVPAPGEVAIRIERAGICATDIEIARGYMSFEGVLGHEFVGIVDAPDQPVWHGTRVVGGINCSCGACPLCHEGLDRHCPNRTVLGILGKPGAFDEKINLPPDNLGAVPDAVPVDDAVYAEPLATRMIANYEKLFQPGTAIRPKPGKIGNRRRKCPALPCSTGRKSGRAVTRWACAVPVTPSRVKA